MTIPVGTAARPDVGRAAAHPTARQVAGAAAAALGVGALVGVAGTGAHQTVLALGDLGGPDGVVLPVGVVLALLLTVLTQACVVALAGALRSSRAVVAVALAGIAGWSAVVVAATVTGPGGDVLVVANGRGTCWVVGGLLLLATVSAVASSLLGRPHELDGPGRHRG